MRNIIKNGLHYANPRRKSSLAGDHARGFPLAFLFALVCEMDIINCQSNFKKLAQIGSLIIRIISYRFFIIHSCGSVLL